MNLILQRVTGGPTECTQGTLQLPDGSFLETLELPWVPDPSYPGGHPDVSCVPAGVYELALHDTPKHPKTFALVNRALGVIHEPEYDFPEARVACLIHVANYPSQLEGCIGVGLTRDPKDPCQIWSSFVALEKLQAQVPWEVGHTLEVRA